MTPNEAVQRAVVNHEFRNYAPATLPATWTDSIFVEAVVAICWCGTPTPPFLSEKSARDAHGRHQAQLVSGVTVKRSDGTDVPLTDERVEVRNDGSIHTTVSWIE